MPCRSAMNYTYQQQKKASFHTHTNKPTTLLNLLPFPVLESSSSTGSISLTNINNNKSPTPLPLPLASYFNSQDQYGKIFCSSSFSSSEEKSFVNQKSRNSSSRNLPPIAPKNTKKYSFPKVSISYNNGDGKGNGSFDMSSIISPDEDTIKKCQEKSHPNTTKCLIWHNIEQEKMESEENLLIRAKQKFLDLQQLQKRQKFKKIILDSFSDSPQNKYPNKKSKRNMRVRENSSQPNRIGHSMSSSASPTLSIGSDDIAKEQQKVKEYISQTGNGGLNLMAVVISFQNYFSETNRVVKTMSSKRIGFTIRINMENKEKALEFIENLEQNPETKIKSCKITNKKTHYNFHAECVSHEQLKNVIQFYMKNCFLAKLAIKVYPDSTKAL